MTLVDEVRTLVRTAREDLAGLADVERLDAIANRLDEPLRVAIAGKVKAGKSTLLNALVGQELAPTDASECTKVVTWYRNGVTYGATLQPRGGEPVQTGFTRDGGPVRVDLGGHRVADLERLVVDWPSRQLERMTLIDTPGIASIRTDVSTRTEAFLASEDEPTAADAVVYLMRHLHPADVSFLEAFHDRDFAQPTPVNTIGILSRADEIGVGLPDAMETAARIAGRYRDEPALRRLCQTVIPVAGLLAETAATLREDEHRALTLIAALPDAERAALLLSVDRFRDREHPGLPSRAEREGLLLRFGMFGLRRSVELIRERRVRDATSLASALLDLSGLAALRAALHEQFADRADALKARSAILALQSALGRHTGPSIERIATEIERILAGAHELAEIRLLAALRAGLIPMTPEDGLDAERLLGTGGTSASSRLGLEQGSDRDALSEAARNALARWQDRANSPLSTRPLAEAARILVRTAEGMLADFER